jgi:hypothetical protein
LTRPGWGQHLFKDGTGQRKEAPDGTSNTKTFSQSESCLARFLWSRPDARIFTEVQMALAILAAEVRIQDRLSELGTTAQFLSALDGRISNSRLSQALRGLKDLENSDAERLLALTKRMVELRECFSPVPIAWKNPVDIQYLLDNLTAPSQEIRQTILQLFRERI